MRVYQCEDSLEGVCTAIYRAYEDHVEHQDTWIRVDEELMLFGEYIPVETDLARAEKVLRTLRRRFGQADYEDLCMALITPDQDRGIWPAGRTASGTSAGSSDGLLCTADLSAGQEGWPGVLSAETVSAFPGTGARNSVCGESAKEPCAALSDGTFCGSLSTGRFCHKGYRKGTFGGPPCGRGVVSD